MTFQVDESTYLIVLLVRFFRDIRNGRSRANLFNPLHLSSMVGFKRTSVDLSQPLAEEKTNCTS